MEYVYTLRSVSIYSHTCTHKHIHIQRGAHILSDKILSYAQQYIPEIESGIIWVILQHWETILGMLFLEFTF